MRDHLLGIPIDILSFNETINIAIEAIEKKKLTHHVALNAAKLVYARRDEILYQDIADSDIVGIDGAGIILAARLLGMPARERVAGVDLMEKLLAICAERGFRPFLLGARQEILEEAVFRSKQYWPKLHFAGFRNGYFTSDEEGEIVSEIVKSKADCLFIGMPTPKKERFLSRYRDQLGVPFIMGVGGGIDVLAGHVKRAPKFMQRAGFEWLYRIYQEPRRMWRRYFHTNLLFAGIVFRAFFLRIFCTGSSFFKINLER